MTTTSLRALLSASVLGFVFAVTPGCAADTEPDEDADGEPDTSEGVGESADALATDELFVWHRTRKDCVVHPNYPNADVAYNGGWTVQTNKALIWRYNVNSEYALVTDPVRATKRQYPWWGFTKRDCIGTTYKQKNAPEGESVPSRVLEGRSQQASGWRKVSFSQGEAKWTGSSTVKNGATLRDPSNFVVGNCGAGMPVKTTSTTRSQGHWVYVDCPMVKRKGWIEADKLK